MAVGPVMLNGVIQRTQDVSMLKQQEDSRPMVEQQQIKYEGRKKKKKAAPKEKGGDKVVLRQESGHFDMKI